jgi:hypothetical protein
VFLRSLGRLVCPATFAAEGPPVFQAIWITRRTCVPRASQLVLADSPSRLASRCSGQPDFCLRDLRTRLAPNGSPRQDLRHVPSQNSRSGRTRNWFQRNSLSIAVLVPRMRDQSGATDNRQTRFDSRHALDCDLLTVIDKMISHFVRTAHPCGCCSRVPLLEHWIRRNFKFAARFRRWF